MLVPNVITYYSEVPTPQQGCSMLHWAAENGHIDVVTVVIDSLHLSTTTRDKVCLCRVVVEVGCMSVCMSLCLHVLERYADCVLANAVLTTRTSSEMCMYLDMSPAPPLVHMSNNMHGVDNTTHNSHVSQGVAVTAYQRSIIIALCPLCS